MINGFQTLEQVMDWLLRVSGQAAVLVILIVLVQALGREKITVRWRYALWLLLVLRLALPVQVPSRFSLFNLTQFRPKAVTDRLGDPVTPPVTGRTETPLKAPSGAADATTVATSAAVPPAPALSGQQQREMTAADAGGWKAWLPLLWLAGVAVLVLRIVVQNFIFHRRLRWAPTVTDTQAWQTLEHCREVMGVRQRLVLVESETIHSPALYGFLRLHLLLPKHTLATLTPEELRFVFLHELAHVKRRDMLVNWVVTALQILHWFNPLVWLGFRRMAADREMAADALALSCLEPRENVAYGNAMLKLLRTLMRPAALPGLVGILEDTNQMKRRITMIAKFTNTSRWPIPAALAFASLALFALTDPSSGSDRKPLKLSGKPAADLAVLRIWNCTNNELSLSTGVSADGRYLSYTDPETGGLMVRDLLKRKNQRVVKVPEPWKEFATGSALSPDGSRIAYGWYKKKGEIEMRIAERDGTRDRLLYQSPGVVWGEPACWSSDGQRIVAGFQMAGGAASSNLLALVSVRDGSIRVVKTFAWDFPAGVSLDPSGRFLAYHIRPNSASPEHEIRLVSVEGEDTLLLGGPWDNTCLGWSPDGLQLLFTSNRRSTIDCWVQHVEDGKLQGTPELLKANLGPVTPIGISRAGGLYYRTSSDSSEIQIAKLDANAAEFVSDPKPLGGKFQGDEAQPHWSPDGKQLAYLSRGVLCVRAMESREEREYALKIGEFFNPAWSADGKSIRVVTSHVNERPGTFRVDLATGEAQRVDLGGFFLFPAKDETVAFRRMMAQPQQILRRNLQTGEDSVLYKLEGEAFGGGWMLSPDAQYLGFGCVRDEGTGWKSMMKSIPAAGGEARVLMSSTNGFSGLAWFPDSRHALVRCGKEICILSLDGEAPRKMKAPFEASEFSIHPGGQQVAFVSKATRSELWLMENAVPAAGKRTGVALR